MELSIITINFNNKDGLERTIKSVANQTARDFEYIVIDGTSTDDSIDVIKANTSIINYWVSEKDTGIYNAMNKGVRVSHGTYCLFLNSGDALLNNRVVERLLTCDLSADIISGDTHFTTGERAKAPQHVTMKTFVVGSLNHQSTLIRRSLLIENPYDERLKIGSDWRFFIQVLIYKNVSYERVPVTVSLSDTTGVSNALSRQSELRLYEQELCRDILPLRIEEDYKFAHFIASWQWRFKRLFNIIRYPYSLITYEKKSFD